MYMCFGNLDSGVLRIRKEQRYRSFDCPFFFKNETRETTASIHMPITAVYSEVKPIVLLDSSDCNSTST